MRITDDLQHRFGQTLALRYSASTVKTYLRTSGLFLQHLQDVLQRPVLAQDLTREHVQAWLDGLPDAPVTVRNKALGALRLVRYIREDEQGPAPQVLIGDLRLPRPAPRRLSVLSEAQSEALCQAPLLVPRAGVHEVLQLRDVALLEVLSAGGLRVAEVCALDLEHLLVEVPCPGALTLHVHGPRNRRRYVPLGGAAAEALRQYLQRRKELVPDGEPAVFVSQDHLRLTPHRQRRLLSCHGERVGLQVSPHLLRRTCGAQLVLAGADLQAVQQFLGYCVAERSSPSTDRDLAFLYAACTLRHPRCRPAGEAPQGADRGRSC